MQSVLQDREADVFVSANYKFRLILCEKISQGKMA